MLGDKALLALVLAIAPAGALGQIRQDPATLKAAKEAIAAFKAPCGEVKEAVENADGDLLVDCSNGAYYAVVRSAGRPTLHRYDRATDKWTTYP